LSGQIAAIRVAGDDVILDAGGTPAFDAALVAAGVWSKPLAASLDENLPVEGSGATT
jgi:hypothetical protein